jgi:hypothetical protein
MCGRMDLCHVLHICREDAMEGGGVDHLRRATAVRGGREASSWVRVGQVQEPGRGDGGGVVAGAEDADGDAEGGGGGREAANSIAAGVSKTCWGR